MTRSTTGCAGSTRGPTTTSSSRSPTRSSRRACAPSTRRAEGGARPAPVLRSGPIALDEHKRLVTVADQPVALTPRAFALLECFLRHPGQVLTRDNLLDAAWPAGVAVTPNTVDAYVHLLRERLGPARRRLHPDRTWRGLPSAGGLT